MNKLARQVSRILHCNSMLVNVMKTILNVKKELEKTCKKKHVVSQIVHILKFITTSDFQRRMSVQFYFSCMRVAKMLFKHKAVLTLERNLNDNYCESKIQGFSYLNGVGMYALKMKELAILNRAAGNFIKNHTKPPLFYMPTFYTSSKATSEELCTLSVDYYTDLSGKYVEILIAAPMLHMCPTSNSLSELSFSLALPGNHPIDRKLALRN